VSEGVWNHMEGISEESDIAGDKGNRPTFKFIGEDISRDFAKFIACVAFSGTIFATAGAGETTKDDSITDTAGFREWFG